MLSIDLISQELILSDVEPIHVLFKDPLELFCLVAAARYLHVPVASYRH
jgi:hypothetical protein